MRHETYELREARILLFYSSSLWFKLLQNMCRVRASGVVFVVGLLPTRYADEGRTMINKDQIRFRVKKLHPRDTSLCVWQYSFISEECN